MKTLLVNITSDDKDPGKVVENILARLHKLGKIDAEDNLKLNAMVECVGDFVAKATVLSSSGTTMKISKEFEFSNCRVVVEMNNSTNTSFLDRFLKLFKS